jgi:hypothetical protein
MTASVRLSPDLRQAAPATGNGKTPLNQDATQIVPTEKNQTPLELAATVVPHAPDSCVNSFTQIYGYPVISPIVSPCLTCSLFSKGHFNLQEESFFFIGFAVGHQQAIE